MDLNKVLKWNKDRTEDGQIVSYWGRILLRNEGNLSRRESKAGFNQKRSRVNRSTGGQHWPSQMRWMVSLGTILNLGNVKWFTIIKTFYIIEVVFEIIPRQRVYR
jgi:hypothetical protein